MTTLSSSFFVRVDDCGAYSIAASLKFSRDVGGKVSTAEIAGSLPFFLIIFN